MSRPAYKNQKEEISILVNAVLRRGYQGLVVFSGKEEDGSHVRVVATRDSLSNVPTLGEVWRIKGEYKRDSIYGVQFYADLCERMPPKGHLVVLFIANNPRFKGIGLSKARKLYSHFGDSLTQLLDVGDTTRLEEVLTPIAAQTLANAWRLNRAESEIVAFLDNHNFNPRLAGKVWRCWGDRAIKVLESNPYSMLAFAGWDVVDKAALKLGVSPSDERRLVGAVESCLYTRLNEKHTLTKHDNLIQRVRFLLRADLTAAERAIQLALEDRAIVGDKDLGYQPIGAALIESGIAKRLIRIGGGETSSQGRLFLSTSRINPSLVKKKIAAFEASYRVTLNEEQREAVMLATSKPLSVLTGGAGVGKTTVLKIVIEIVEEAGGTVYQMALSGRAAQRMKEATAHDATTIAGFISSVQKGHLNIESDSLVIVDEASMLDLPITHRIVRNLPEGVRLLMVGDPYQLPPIGFGLVFHKIAESNTVPRVELKYVHRQTESSGIPSVALAIRRGVLPQLEPFCGLGTGVTFIDCVPDKIVGVLFDVYKLGGDGSDTQVLGMTKSGVAGVRAVNDYFHQALSPGRPRLPQWMFAKEDPVIHLENDYERLLFNGTLGHVTDIRNVGDELSLACEFDGVEHTFKETEFDKIALAYGITVHKAQGSQFRRVAIPVTKSRLLDRTMIYTALTRGIEQVVFVGDRHAFAEAVRKSPLANSREVKFTI
ncbi:MAG TPA: AAA family ATPase [Pyrinomonadaceae bacterium]|jgi:exodeoxyribonuclease V alpha subunit